MRYKNAEWKPWIELADREFSMGQEKLISQTNPKYRVLVWLAFEFVNWINRYGRVDAQPILKIYEAEYKKVIG